MNSPEIEKYLKPFCPTLMTNDEFKALKKFASSDPNMSFLKRIVGGWERETTWSFHGNVDSYLGVYKLDQYCLTCSKEPDKEVPEEKTTVHCPCCGNVLELKVRVQAFDLK
jgi:DNA-directed RNA polymerase subunit RPC12/RpoP